MGYFSRHFCKRRPARVEGKEAPTRVPLIIDEVPPAPTADTVPSWTVSAPNRPPLVVRAETEQEARKAARESWGLARLPNGTSVAAL